MKTNILEEMRKAGDEDLGARPRIRRILTSTDFSYEARVGTDYAMRLADKVGASVHMVHVIEPLPNMEGMEGFPVFPAPSEMTAQAETRLRQIARAQTVKGLQVSTSVRIGKPFHRIISAASEQSSDLIILATHGYTGLDHALLGSTAERVVRHAPCSVLSIPICARGRGTGQARLRIDKVLVPLDFSDASKTALPWAACFANFFGSEIALCNVTEIFPIDHLMGRELMNHAITPLMEEARAGLERISENLATATEAKIAARVVAGVPHKEICQAARELHADLIVLTTHGYTGLKRVWLGSTAERVVRHANCPVLVVRQAHNSRAK